MGSRKRVLTALRKGQNSVEMGSEICNKIKPWIFHSKIIPNVSCSVSLLLPLLPALHLLWHHPSINAPPLIEASITAVDQMAPILLAQPQHSHGTCQVELAARVYLTFTFFVIVHHADNCFGFFLYPLQRNNLCPGFTYLLGSLLWSCQALYWTPSPTGL